MFKLIVSDLDGTIFSDNNSISQDNLEAINTLKENNIPFVVCTGKTYSLSKNICKTLNANFGIFGNGNQIINLATGEELSKKTLNFENVKNCFSIINKYNLHVHIYTENSIITTTPMYLDLRNSILFPDMIKLKIVNSVFEYIEKEKPTILKLVISSNSSLSSVKEMLEKYDDLSITHITKTGNNKDSIINKEYEYLDISPSNVTKGVALEELKNYLSLQKEDILSIGDNVNDISMFKASGIGVAVNNAYEEVKQVANFTTSHSAENGGFAEAIYKFIEF